MRGLGLIGLVLALLIVGLVAKKQMTSVVAAPVGVPPVAGESTGTPGTAHEQAQRVQQQVKDALDAAAKTRQVPDDN